MVGREVQFTRGAGCCLGTDIENVAPFSGKITICLQYLLLVLVLMLMLMLMLMRGSEF
jgi:hypothetical protein